MLLLLRAEQVGPPLPETGGTVTMATCLQAVGLMPDERGVDTCGLLACDTVFAAQGFRRLRWMRAPHGRR
jgi:hypothetical protein